MVFESITNPFLAEKKPVKVFLLSFVLTSLSIFLGLWIFRSYASMVFVFLTVIGLLPLMYRVIRLEEKKDMKYDSEKRLLYEHIRAIKFFIYMFFGIVIATAFWYVVLPSNIIPVLFSFQASAITEINAAATSSGFFLKILMNNLRVLLLCILFAFIYGVGAIFILAWNAAVLGTAMGNLVRIELSKITELVGMTKISNYFSIISFAFFRYVTHGIFEVISYFIAGLAGGIISFAVVNHDYRKKQFKRMLGDTTILLLLAFFFLLIGALVECYVTPYLF